MCLETENLARNGKKKGAETAVSAPEICIKNMPIFDWRKLNF